MKVDGDGCGWKQSLRGRVGMGVISVPVQVSSLYKAVMMNEPSRLSLGFNAVIIS